MATQLAHDLLEAINIITESGISRHKYDRTFEAKVVASNRKTEGIYKVEYQTTQFDAVAQDGGTYYDGDVVYVMVPENDFSKQKFIIARKIIDEENNTKPLHFKLPFDDYVPMDTFEGTAIENNGWYANKPIDGNSATATAELDAAIARVNISLQEKTAEIESEIENVREKCLETIDTFLNSEQVPVRVDSTESLCTETFFNGLLTLINEQYTSPNTSFATSWNTYVTENWDIEDVKFSLSTVEQQQLIARNNTNFNIAINNFNQELDEYSNGLVATLVNEIPVDTNSDLMWYWKPQGEEPARTILHSQFGISVNVKTLLDFYKPRTGKYGMRVLILGRTRPTETEAARAITIDEVYFTNDDMYGNTYGYYEYYTQQKLFEIGHLQTINGIFIYFWQDHDFKDQFGQEIPYEYEANSQSSIAYETDEHDTPITKQMEPNIFFDEVKAFVGTTVEEASHDSVYLYTYDDLYYNITDDLENVGEANRNMRMAWAHITDEGPVLVDKLEGDDPKSFAYWKAHIYWFHYEEGCEQDASLFHVQRAGANWKLLEDETDKIYVSITPDKNVVKDQYKAMVVYEGPRAVDAVLTFFNNDTTGGATEKATAEVIFKMFREEQVYDENGTLTSSTIVNDYLLPMANIYDQHGRAVYTENGARYSDLWYYVQVWIRNNEKNEYVPFLYDENVGLASVVWHEPTSDTLIKNFSTVSDEEFARNDLIGNQWSSVSDENYRAQLRNITRKFKPDARFSYNCLNNTISAFVQQGGFGYRPQITIYFDKNETMGSKYNLSIALNDKNEIVKGESFNLIAKAIDPHGQAVNLENCKVNWELLSPTDITTQSGQEIDLNDQVGAQLENLVVTNDNPPIIKVKVRGLDSYELSYTRGFRLVCDGDIAQNYSVSCPTRVEFKSDGSNPVYESTDFLTTKGISGINWQLFPEWELVQFYKDGSTWTELDLSRYFQLDSGTMASSNTFIYMQLPLKVPTFEYEVEDETGEIQTDYTGNFADRNYIEIELDRILVDEAVPKFDEHYPVWYEENDISFVTSNEDLPWFTYAQLKRAAEQYYQTACNIIDATDALPEGVAEDTLEEWQEEEKARMLQLFTTRMNVLTAKAGQSLETFTRYRLCAKNMEDAQFLWNKYLETNYYTYIGFGDPEGTVQITGYNITTGQKLTTPETLTNQYVRQAIPFVQNRYSSSLINNWDNKFFFDEEKGQLFTQLLSAGTKDSDNKYTGVLMGDWSEEADESLSTPGLYGFYKGSQVFGFKTDGTGFIGGADHGRIEFDGAHSLISNHSKTMYLNLDPMTYDDTTFKDRESYSPYFLYAEIKKPVPPTLDTYPWDWAESADFADATKEYFVVNPSKGVLTTGGIISKYGKIGNWIISEDGLYQELKAGIGSNPKTDRYMQLGYSIVDRTEANQAYQQKIDEISGDTTLSDDEKDAAKRKVYTEATDALLKADNNKYAIWCGYSKNADPLFSVNWRGAMQAREGLIGYHSPWLITDNGLISTYNSADLTSENNFGTIFLGRPDAPYDMSSWATFGDNILQYNSDGNYIVYNHLAVGESSSYIYSLKNDTEFDTTQTVTRAWQNIWGETIYSENTGDTADGFYAFIPLEDPDNPGEYLNNEDTAITVYHKGDRIIDQETQQPIKDERTEVTRRIWTQVDYNKYAAQYDVITPAWSILTFSYTMYNYRYETTQEKVYLQYAYASGETTGYEYKENKGPKAFGTCGNFAIQAGNRQQDRAIHFGVRLDGTIFSDRAMLGQWRVNNKYIVSYANDIEEPQTDTRQDIKIVDDTNTIIGYKDETLLTPIYKQKVYGQTSQQTVSSLCYIKLDALNTSISLYEVNTGTTTRTGLKLNGMNSSIIFDSAYQINKDYLYPRYATPTWNTQSVSKQVSGHTVSYDVLQEPSPYPVPRAAINSLVIQNQAQTAQLCISDVQADKASRQILLIPLGSGIEMENTDAVNGVLGVPERRWDLYAHKIWLPDSEVATQKWVLETLQSILGTTASS